jgi:uncharacterized protein YbaA (DUF1428 family)
VLCTGRARRIDALRRRLRAAGTKKESAGRPFWIVFKSKAHRNRVNAKVMKDKRLAGMMDGKAMPFDVKRMVYGEFKTLVDL